MIVSVLLDDRKKMVAHNDVRLLKCTGHLKESIVQRHADVKTDAQLENKNRNIVDVTEVVEDEQLNSDGSAVGLVGVGVGVGVDVDVDVVVVVVVVVVGCDDIVVVYILV